MHVSRSRLAVCAHFSNLYLMLLGPGADKSEAVLSTVEISSRVMGGHIHVGTAGGSSS
jgi:hypothetical protein